MTKHETREYAFLLLYEAMVRTEELNTIEDLYASTEEMLELPIPEKVKQYVKDLRACRKHHRKRRLATFADRCRFMKRLCIEKNRT